LFFFKGVLFPDVAHLESKRGQGKLFIFDFKAPQNGVQQLKITGDIDQQRFFPHGMKILKQAGMIHACTLSQQHILTIKF